MRVVSFFAFTMGARGSLVAQLLCAFFEFKDIWLRELGLKLHIGFMFSLLLIYKHLAQGQQIQLFLGSSIESILLLVI